ncbi:MAG TPA: hypothetical protein VGC76_18935 [Pyrinomonadaceae bacterium]|jgi:hypothetical protein
MKKVFCLLALSLMLALTAFADVKIDTPTPKAEKTPKQVKSIDTTLYISLESNAKEARLLIPKSQIKQLRMELAQLDDGDADAPVASSFTRAQTVASGLFLSLALVFGGVWFARSRKSDLKTNKTIAVGAILLFAGAFATIAFANVGPPPEARSITGKIFSDAVHQYSQASGKIKVETTDEEYGIQLIVPDAPSETKPNREE